MVKSKQDIMKEGFEAAKKNQRSNPYSIIYQTLQHLWWDMGWMEYHKGWDKKEKKGKEL